nr:G patch domain and ankyrin repeat-containing protein 1 homolog isoform X2 [Nicotiana tomentosiformis]
MRSGGGGVEYESAGLGLSMSYAETGASSTSIPIHSSNLGFKLLKKHGWREGTGLGIAEQGRLEPVPTYIKKNKRGLGAEKSKKAAEHHKSSGLSLGGRIVKDGEKEKVRLRSEFVNVAIRLCLRRLMYRRQRKSLKR